MAYTHTTPGPLPGSGTIKSVFRGDDKAELVAAGEEFIASYGWGYSPSVSSPVMVEGQWEIYASRYASCD